MSQYQMYEIRKSKTMARDKSGLQKRTTGQIRGFLGEVESSDGRDTGLTEVVQLGRFNRGKWLQLFGWIIEVPRVIKNCKGFEKRSNRRSITLT